MRIVLIVISEWKNLIYEKKGPLVGIKIIDLTAMVSGPTATMMLGDQGADVIKLNLLEES